MPLELMIALILVMPIIILFAIFVWYLNFKGIYATVKETRQDQQTIARSERPGTSQF